MYRYIVISLIFFGTIKNGFGQTHVQTRTTYQTTTGTTISRALTGSTTSGNLLIVHVDWDGQTRSVTSITDNKGNTYTRINGPTNWNGPNYRAELWYAYNVIGGGAPITVTATLSGAPTSFSQIYVSEYSGIVSSINPLDQNSVAIGSTAAVNSGSKTTTHNNELVYGVSIGASGTLSTGAGFNNRSTANSNIVEDKNVVAAGSYNAAFTSAGGNWVAQMATFMSTSTVLPIDLLSFTGKCNDNDIVLEWATATELNNDYFTIERSEDGANWQTVGTVKSAGNSSISQKYSFATNATTNDISYFRLKQTDIDGKFNYFKIISVNNCHKDSRELNIYPNPSNGRSLFGKINLKPNETYSIAIFDNFGKPVTRIVSSQPEFAINFAQLLPSGIYFARFSSGSFSTVKPFLVKH